MMKKYRGYICLVAGILMMLALGTVYSWSVFRLPIENHFKINSLLSGLPYMTSLVFYSLFMVITGRYRVRLPLKYWMYLGSVMIGLGWILSSLTSNIWLFTLTYGVMIGAGVGILYGIPMLLAAEWFPKKRGLMVGLVLSGFGLSPLVSASLARYLIASKGLMLSFLYIGTIYILILPLLSSIMNSPATTSCPASEKNDKSLPGQVNTRAMLKLNSFKVLYFCYFIGTAIGLTMIGLSYPVGVDYIGANSEKVAFFLSVFAISNGLGRPFFGWFTDRFSPLSSMRLSYGLIMLAVGLMLIFQDKSFLVYGTSFAIFWFNLGGWLALAPAATLRYYGICHFSRNYGLIFTAYGLGALFGVLASGFLKDWTGAYQAIFWFVFMMACTGLFVSHHYRKSL